MQVGMFNVTFEPACRKLARSSSGQLVQSSCNYCEESGE